jgi:hypothetical protein
MTALQTSLLGAACACGIAAAAAAQGGRAPDHYLPSRPENIQWGWYPIDVKAALTITSGETVPIDTLAGQGSTQDEDPGAYLESLGGDPRELLQDVRDF